jgi:hypothetical protein
MENKVVACPLCGCYQVESKKILWAELIETMELSEEKVQYLDKH